MSTSIIGRENQGPALAKSAELNTMRIREVVAMRPITTVPQTSDWLMGVFRHRGKQIPLMDYRMVSWLDGSGYTVDTCIIIVDVYGETGPLSLGLLVDSPADAYELSAGIVN